MVRIYSRLLEETIVCVEDEQRAPEQNGSVIYTRAEVNALQGLPAASLRTVHAMKKHFGGWYIGPET